MLAAGRKGAGLRVFANKCDVKGREEQHDPMFFEWSCTGRRIEARVPHASGWRRQTRPRLKDFPLPESPVQDGCAGDETEVRVHDQEADPNGASEHVAGAVQDRGAVQETDDPMQEAEMGADVASTESAVQDGSADEEAEEPVHEQEAEPNGASEHVAGSAQVRGAEEDADELMQEEEMEADDVSSRGSSEWGDKSDHDDPRHHDGPRGDDSVGDEESSVADGGPHRDNNAQFDELGAIGFALAKSAALLPEFQVPARPVNCIDAWWRKPLTGTCTREGQGNLNSCMTDFFLRRPVLQSTPFKEDKDSARVLKTSAEIERAWQLIFERRRRGEPDDSREIQSPDRLKDMWNAWMQDWFTAWTHRNVGGKHFVMAIWQTGITWAPPVELLNNNINGALEHVAKHFASWTRRLARGVTRHKRYPETVEARRKADRAARRKARSDYYQTVDLLNQLKASKGKGKGKRGKKSWAQMSDTERWWLQQLWSGSLRRVLDAAEAKCHRVQAGPFRILDVEA